MLLRISKFHLRNTKQLYPEQVQHNSHLQTLIKLSHFNTTYIPIIVTDAIIKGSLNMKNLILSYINIMLPLHHVSSLHFFDNFPFSRMYKTFSSALRSFIIRIIYRKFSDWFPVIILSEVSKIGHWSLCSVLFQCLKAQADRLSIGRRISKMDNRARHTNIEPKNQLYIRSVRC